MDWLSTGVPAGVVTMVTFTFWSIRYKHNNYHGYCSVWLKGGRHMLNDIWSASSYFMHGSVSSRPELHTRRSDDTEMMGKTLIS